ncbi:acetylornithine deacetylase [Rhizobium sp. TRM95111]|uniref:acetylornithine deacetylase n=1 Tax=Rhizobium alarense TaxID=2846851 RepID=UPI001F1CEC82|nr:acetylornithine deacetylase [Rhizobium alarense]MCF3641605.1 acetylornithine deacetylase [Rhizobium alarense]
MRTLDILEKLVAFPSISAASNLDIIEFCRAELSAHGFDCRLVHDTTAKKANLFASIGPASDDGILLSGHTDVVPIEGQAWTSSPFTLTRRNDRVLGRGTTDMKGFLASVLALAPEAARQRLKRPLHIAFSHDEEIGCVGVRSLLADLKSRDFKAALAIIGEPTSMMPVIGHKGKLAARANCRGAPGHSASAPLYLNAIHLACAVVEAIREVQAELEGHSNRDADYPIPYSTVHAGVIGGGKALNIVAEDAFVDFEIRHLAGDDASTILAGIKDKVASRIAPLISSFPGAGVAINTHNLYPALTTEKTSPALAFVQGLLSASQSSKVSFGTEAGLFAQELEIPSIVIGPGDMAQGHQPDEYISIRQLDACSNFLTTVLEKLR